MLSTLSISIDASKQRILQSPSTFGMMGGTTLGNDMTGSVDPEKLLSDGMNVLDVLNVTIIETEKQIQYYAHVSQVMTEVCYDFSSLNNATMYILLGCIVLLLSEVIVFAYHIKSFSDWENEIESMKIGQRLLAYEQLDKQLDEEECMMDQTANDMISNARSKS